MRSLLKLPSFCVLVQLCMAMSLAVDVDVLEKRDNVTLKAPVVAVPSQHWEGVDGNWSTFEIRVGTPAQVARVLPATSWQEVWVIWGNVVGVCNTTSGVEENCGDERGGLFESTSSSTWEQGDQNFLGLNTDLGYSGEAQYGFDTVGLGYDTSEGPTLTHQIVAEIESQTFFFGQLGMGFQPTNFSGYGDPQASFSDTLYSNGTISSMSWSYTAGAYYRLKSVFGQLIFGGVDESRYTPNDVIFTMTGDNLRDIVVTIRSITSTTSSGNTTLMSTPEFAFIDSTVTELWLPTSVCQEFESAFGLTWNDTAGLYLINASTHENLLSLNPNITITLANQKTGGTTTDIVLPYDSFDLSVSPPILENETSLYFPLKRADDETQYTLGRTFLQEAYVTTHYNSRTFNVSQCVFSDDTSAHIVALPATLPTTATNSTSSSNGTTPGTTSSKPSHSHLSGGAIAGIVIGSLIAGLAIIGALALCCLRRRRAVAAEKKNTRPSTPVAEIDSGKRIEPAGSSAYTAQASAFTHEAGGRALPAKATEIAGNPVMHPQELEAEVPLVQGHTASPPLNGVSDSSGGTEGTGVSSMSPTEQQQQFGGGPLGAAELSGGGIRNMERGNDFEVVSPNSPTMPSMMERRRGDFNGGGGRDNGNGNGNPDIRVTEASPTISSAGVSLSPDTPQAPFGAMGRRGGGIGRQTGTGSRFEERW